MKMADKSDYFLVPLDANCSERIPVPHGETTLGRGPFLKITDKRVSRSHATLTNDGRRLLLRMKHATNPCFYKPAGNTAYTQLKKDEERFLSHGDCFSFLPKSLRFELQCVPAATAVVEDRAACVTEEEHEKDHDGQEDGAMVKPSDQAKKEHGALKADASTTHQTDADIHQTGADIHQTGADIHQTGADIHQTGADIHQTNADCDTHLIDLTRQTDADTRQVDVDSRQKCPDTVTAVSKGIGGNTVQSGSVVGSLGKKRKLPGWLSRGSMDGEKEDTRSSKEKRTKGKTPKTTAVASKPAAKRRARISSDEDVKESAPKKKPSQRKRRSETPPLLDPSGEEADEQFSEQVSHAGKSPLTTKSPLPADKSLPPCPYGKSCYRKNPSHFKEYSHLQGDTSKKGDDSDSLSDTDIRPECAYGSACYRRNTLHQQQYRHTVAPTEESVRRSSRTRRKKTATTRRGRSTLCDDESDDDGLANTYDYDDSFIDDDGMNSSASSGGDDSDEDWQHPGNNGGGEESEEDIKELAKEASEFVANPKLHRR